jgi:predicted molibdopterin-dependent oxidoreductase YjgC
MVKYGYLWESDVKGDFEMEIEAGELVLKFHARYSTRKTETYEYKNTKDEDTWVTDGLGEHFELTFDFEER